MLATLIYACAHKVLSSRQIEILCRKRVEFPWISGQTMPDHATIARFRERKGNPTRAALDKVNLRIGERSMEVELLREKARGSGAFWPRGSKR